jgi:hypothetical protein
LPELPPVPAYHDSDEESDDEMLLKDQAEMMQAAFETSLGFSDYVPLSEGLELAFQAICPEVALSAVTGTETEPRTYAEAMRRPDADLWRKAAEDEIQALLENGTWELVKLPPGKKAIGGRWVFKVKRNADGSVERYKGRYVAKGYLQRPGVDFGETFAPTAKWATLRVILAIAAFEDLELESVDISSAFLNGDIDTEIYMTQPEGFEQRGPEWVNRVWKGLYGLKQANHLWHVKLDKVLSLIGFTKIRSDHSVWVWKKDHTQIIVPVFVDDMTIAAKSKDDIMFVKEELKKHFKLRDLGPTNFLLGVAIAHDRSQRQITLSQRQYVLDILERHGMSDCSPVSTPMDPGLKLQKDMPAKNEKDARFIQDFDYKSAVGELLYLAISTRPDIARTVSVLCRFNSNPCYEHYKAVKHLWRYLQGTLDLKLTFRPVDSAEPFTTYSDADHGGCPDSGKSTSGYVVKMGTSVVGWMSKLQSLVALSTTEAEYVAATSAAQELIWMRSLFSELGIDLPGPSTLYIDNQSALAVAKNPEHHGRMKHLDLRFFWLRDQVERGLIKVTYLPTADMPADMLTKSLERIKVERGRALLGVL